MPISTISGCATIFFHFNDPPQHSILHIYQWVLAPNSNIFTEQGVSTSFFSLNLLYALYTETLENSSRILCRDFKIFGLDIDFGLS